MNRLVEDEFVRRLCQVLLLGFALGGSAVALTFDLVVLGLYSGLISGDDYFSTELLHVVAVTSNSDLSNFLAPGISALPVIVATVCFKIDSVSNPKKSLDALNFTGRVLILLLVIGLLSNISALIIIINLPKTIDDVVPNSAQITKSIFVSLFSFQAMYLTQLMGLRPK